jgi:hypothetical protein
VSRSLRALLFSVEWPSVLPSCMDPWPGLQVHPDLLVYGGGLLLRVDVDGVLDVLLHVGDGKHTGRALFNSYGCYVLVRTAAMSWLLKVTVCVVHGLLRLNDCLMIVVKVIVNLESLWFVINARV